MRASPSRVRDTFFSSAIGARSAKTSSVMGANCILSLHLMLRSSLISSRVFVICDIRSVCSCKSLKNSAVSGFISVCSTEKSSICACIKARGVRSSCAAFPVNCRCAVNPSLSRSIILLKEWLNCLNSGKTSLLIFISDRLFG